MCYYYYILYVANCQEASYETFNILTLQHSAISSKPTHACIVLYIALYKQSAPDKMFCKYLNMSPASIVR